MEYKSVTQKGLLILQIILQLHFYFQTAVFLFPVRKLMAMETPTVI
jgi:hypothetical protein